MVRFGALLVLGLTAMVATAACSAAPAAPTPSATSDLTLTAEQWSADLDFLDAQIRAGHPAPFLTHPESEWVAKIAELNQSLAGMAGDQAVVAITELVALLDTHSGVFPDELGFSFYGLLLREFPDGVYVLGAEDTRLVGAHLTAIGSAPIDEVLQAIAPLVNADNESGLHWLRPLFTVTTEVLQVKGFVTDASAPEFSLTLPDGSTTVENPPIISVDSYAALSGEVPGAPAAWNRSLSGSYSDVVQGAFVLAYNRPGDDVAGEIEGMFAALADGSADRVVLDMRYAGGGEFGTDPTQNLIRALQDPRVDRAGHLVVTIGQDNISASTALASTLAQTTSAIFVGEPTPARPAGFLDETTITLPTSRIIVHFPTTLLNIAGEGDTRDALRPDIPTQMTGVEFFAGDDTVLAAALAAR